MVPSKGCVAWASPEQGQRARLSPGLWKVVSWAQRCRGGDRGLWDTAHAMLGASSVWMWSLGCYPLCSWKPFKGLKEVIMSVFGRYCILAIKGNCIIYSCVII